MAGQASIGFVTEMIMANNGKGCPVKYILTILVLILNINISMYFMCRWLATTQLGPIYARRAFPCWDEPHLKATFDIAIRHLKNLHVISNMHQVGIEPYTEDINQRVTTFATTPTMSTYLVAFAVSEFGFISNKDETFKIWARPNALKYGEFPLKIGEQILRELEAYTGITYASVGFQKMNFFAIPQGLPAAMENWGLVTYW